MELGKCTGARIAVTAADVTATTITIPVANQAKGAIAVLRSAAGALKAWDGAITVANESITLDNTGTVDFADTDTFDVISF